MSFSDPVANVKQFNLPPEAVVVDLGAGSGAYTLALARVLPRGTVYAVDVQKELLTRLAAEAKHRHLTNVKIIWGDVERVHGTTLADGIADFVLVSNLLFQTPAKYNLFLEARRILKADGRLAVIDWQDSFGGLGPRPEAVVKPAEVEKIAESVGLKLASHFAAGAHHYGLIFHKL